MRMQYDEQNTGDTLSTDSIPVFVTYAISEDNVRQVLHHSFSTSIHKVECALVIWFLELVGCCEPEHKESAFVCHDLTKNADQVVD